MNPDERLAHALRMKFKTSYEEPTIEQLSHIKKALLQGQQLSRLPPTARVWRGRIRQAIWSKDLRACMIGKRYLIDRSDLDRFIDARLQELA